VLVIAVALLYRLAPNVTTPWRWVLAGAALFAVGWLVATFGFAWYVGNMGNYGATYGALGSVIVLMLWFYLTAILLVGAATLTIVTASVVDPSALARRREEIAAVRREREAREGRDRREARPSGAAGERRMGPPDRRRASGPTAAR
jgi:uncharacterized BrkB/YihY/UPF0761 family membrane protein